MTNPRTVQPDSRTVIVGVDTHKHVHVAVAIDTWGIRRGETDPPGARPSLVRSLRRDRGPRPSPGSTHHPDLADAACGLGHRCRHRRRDADHLWRHPRSDSCGSRLRQALRGLPHPGFVRDDDGAPPPLPRRASTGERRAPPGRHRADAVPLTNPQRRRTTPR